MGRYYWSKKEEADDLKKIQTWWLKKYGYFNGWGSSGTIKWTNSSLGKESSVGIQTTLSGQEKYLRIYYTQTKSDGSKKDFDCKIPLTTTPCHFGGKRYWFFCSCSANGVYCGRRVGVLYLGGEHFACRHCYNLTYNSRNLSKAIKAFDQLFEALDSKDDEDGIKRKFYAGKITKRYERYLKKQGKNLCSLRTMEQTFT